MLSKSCQLLCQKIQLLCSRRSEWASLLLLLVLCNGCSPTPSPDVELKINVVKSAGRPGIYNLSGSTNLPNQSQITIAAIRYLRPAPARSLSLDANTTYAILDRQIVGVSQGKWQATLNLWQVAPDGRFREVWQLNQSPIELSLNPARGVSFIASFEPAAQMVTPQQQKNQIQELKGSLVRFTNEGQPYIQTSQTLPIDLPALATRPPLLHAEDINGGWGNRSDTKPEPPVSSGIRLQLAKTGQTNAPLSPSEFLR